MRAILSARIAPGNEGIVDGLAARVTKALRNAIDGVPADPPPLAVGLLGVLAQMPTVLSFNETSQHRQRLRDLTFATIEPILVLHQAIQIYYERHGSGAPSLRFMP